MEFRILTSTLLERYRSAVGLSPLEKLDRLPEPDMPVDYFQFYKSVSSVYSSKIEGEDIEFDSYFKHRFLHLPFLPDYTKKADDLYAAYDFVDGRNIDLQQVQQAHVILSASLLPASQQGVLRTTPMFVINSDDRIEYVAADPAKVPTETAKLFHDIALLSAADLDAFEVFYYAALIHLVFVKIHPFPDGNGRTARLLEKWFLQQKIGPKAAAVPLEKHYYTHLADYYANIRKLGLEYDTLDYEQAFDFLLMTVEGIGGTKGTT